MAYFDDNGEVICSFCGRPQSQVRRLVAGPDVYICDDCVGACAEFLGIGEAEDAKASEEKAPEDELSFETLPAPSPV